MEQLTPDELTAIEQITQELAKIAAIPCTFCKYCLADCPIQIEIPVCFSLYNESKRGGSLLNRKLQYKAIAKGRRASDCTACGAYLTHCPQKINIPTELTEVVKAFT